jgi:hypothetical protein
LPHDRYGLHQSHHQAAELSPRHSQAGDVELFTASELVQGPRQPSDRCGQTREGRGVSLPPGSLPGPLDDLTALIKKVHQLTVLVSDVFVLDHEKLERPLAQ